MSASPLPYTSPQAVEQAIKDAAKALNRADPSRKIDDLVRQAYFDRFLSRVFNDGDTSQWILKGGSGMLAQVANTRRTLDVDLVTHEITFSQPRLTDPANRLPLPRLASNPYRLYPLPEQIADKVCATLMTYHGRPSSREKDAVDLVVIALTQTIPAEATHTAIHHQADSCQMRLPNAFTVPASWGAMYAKLAANTPASGYDLAAAQTLLSAFIDPLLDGTTLTENTWNPITLMWTDQPSSGQSELGPPPAGGSTLTRS
jgi:hypothetical protein